MGGTDAEQAYNGGRASLSILWPDDATEEQRTPGMHHCPFGIDQPELRAEWGRGLRDALEAKTYDPATIIRQIDDELGAADHVG